MLRRKDVIWQLSERLDMKQMDVRRMIEAYETLICEWLEKGETIQLTGFGTFSVRTVPDHMAQNPNGGGEIYVRERRYAAFRSGRRMDRAVGREEQNAPDPAKAE